MMITKEELAEAIQATEDISCPHRCKGMSLGSERTPEMRNLVMGTAHVGDCGHFWWTPDRALFSNPRGVTSAELSSIQKPVSSIPDPWLKF